MGCVNFKKTPRYHGHTTSACFPPVGLILCSSAGENIVRYTLDTLPNKVLAREYQLALPEEKRLSQELAKTRKKLEGLLTTDLKSGA